MENQGFKDDGDELPRSLKEPKRVEASSNPLVAWREFVGTTVNKNRKLFDYGVVLILVIAYHAYFIGCIIRYVYILNAMKMFTKNSSSADIARRGSLCSPATRRYVVSGVLT